MRIGYDEAVAHRLLAGADMLLNPARYEPCGLTAVYAMRYGTPPIARRTGGLIDTVVDVGPRQPRRRFGDRFPVRRRERRSDDVGLHASRAEAVPPEDASGGASSSPACCRDFGWTRSAREYAELYRQMMRQAAPEKGTTGGRTIPRGRPLFPCQCPPEANTRGAGRRATTRGPNASVGEPTRYGKTEAGRTVRMSRIGSRQRLSCRRRPWHR